MRTQWPNCIQAEYECLLVGPLQNLCFGVEINYIFFSKVNRNIILNIFLSNIYTTIFPVKL